VSDAITARKVTSATAEEFLDIINNFSGLSGEVHSIGVNQNIELLRIENFWVSELCHAQRLHFSHESWKFLEKKFVKPVLGKARFIKQSHVDG